MYTANLFSSWSDMKEYHSIHFWCDWTASKQTEAWEAKATEESTTMTSWCPESPLRLTQSTEMSSNCGSPPNIKTTRVYFPQSALEELWTCFASAQRLVNYQKVKAVHSCFQSLILFVCHLFFQESDIPERWQTSARSLDSSRLDSRGCGTQVASDYTRLKPSKC